MTKTDYSKQVFQAGDWATNAFSGERAQIVLCFIDCDPPHQLETDWYYTHCVIALHLDGELVVTGQGSYDLVSS